MRADCFAVIAVALPLPRLYHYQIPSDLLETLEVGHGVLVPFGPRKVSGFVIERTDVLSIDPSRLKPIERLLSPEPLFDADLLPFFRWTSEYYHHPLGEVIRTALPAGMLIESHATCNLTDQGATHLATLSSDDSSPATVFLRFLHERGPQNWSRLMERPPVPGLVSLVRNLTDAGQVHVAQRLEAVRLKPQFVEVYRLAPGVTPRDAKGTTQQAVLQMLGELGEADQEALKEGLEARGRSTGSLTGALKRLQELELIELEQQETWREGGEGFALPDLTHALTGDQATAAAAIDAALEARRFYSCVLFGVTGSGKTEVYMQAVARALEQGLGAIILVPEIALTPQLVGRFRARFGNRVACLHSGLSHGERYDAWRRLQRGDAQVAVGARSAVFAPVRNLGLVVVDEEHDSSFKQDTGLRYSARDLAVVRAKHSSGVVVLGSATPSLETIANTRRGRFTRLELPSRVEARPMPKLHIVDMTRPESRPRLEHSTLSPQLEDALRETVAAGRQAIILLNRRGFAPFVLCSSCGGAFRCLHCDISLTYHRRKHLLLCHYCGLGRALPRNCPHCGEEELGLMGQGTERLEQFLEEQLPGTAIGRLDRDTASGKDAHARILDAFRRETLQVLVGTQMVVKGHDFPRVTLVGIVHADYALNLPDFRASERTFQLVTQVAGRAGRGEEPGEVIVQTYSPQHPSIRFAAQHDYEGFYRQEMRIRRAHAYPPYARLALLHVSAREEALAERQARQVARVLKDVLEGQAEPQVEVLGPAPSPLTRLQQWYRWQVLLKSSGVAPIHALLRQAEVHPGFQPSQLEVRVAIDMDPQNLL